MQTKRSQAKGPYDLRHPKVRKRSSISRHDCRYVSENSLERGYTEEVNNLYDLLAFAPAWRQIEILAEIEQRVKLHDAWIEGKYHHKGGLRGPKAKA